MIDSHAGFLDTLNQWRYDPRVIELKKPSTQLLESYLESIEEMRQLGETIWEGIIPKTGESSPSPKER